MPNIQPAARHNAHREPDIVTAVIPGLALSDDRAREGVSGIVGDMRITTAPKHPGRDPVSVHVVDQLAAVLRGDGGFVERLTALEARLDKSAKDLRSSLRLHELTDQDLADTLRLMFGEDRP